MDKYTILISAVTGGIIGIFSSSIVAFFNYKTMLGKVRAELISTERLRWLNELRTRYSIFFSYLDNQISIVERPVSKEYIDAIQDSFDKFTQNASEHSNMIIVLLNPDKKEQLELRKSVNNSIIFFKKCIRKKNELDNPLGELVIDWAEYTDIKNRSLTALTVIGKETWSKIKELK